LDNVRRCPLQDFEHDIRHTATLTVAAWQIPHSAKRSKGGEDTYFISEEGSAMGVFDGVGGWSESGINPREYSYALAMGCKVATDTQHITEPQKILQYSYEQCTKIVGSSTAVVAVITGTNFSAVNLGDSGFRIIRDGAIVLASKEQQHVFNMPFQLGYESSDTPAHATHYKFSLKDGDIVVLASDGVFDNLYDSSISHIASKYSQRQAQEIAKYIAEEAQEISENEGALSPFSENAKHLGYNFGGGKPDDITVLVATYKEVHAKL